MKKVTDLLFAKVCGALVCVEQRVRHFVRRVLWCIRAASGPMGD